MTRFQALTYFSCSSQMIAPPNSITERKARFTSFDTTHKDGFDAAMRGREARRHLPNRKHPDGESAT
jgi:hypothetical protein